MNSQATTLSGEVPERRYSWRTVLEERNMRWYFGTQLISLTGLMIRSSLMSLLVIDIVGVAKAPPIIGYIWAMGVLPGAFLAPFSGLILDRHSKRQILQGSAVLSMIQSAMLAYLTFGSNIHSVEIWKLLAIALFGGFTNVFDSVGRSAIIKEAVIAKENMRVAGVMFNTLYTVGMILGGGVAGYLVLYVGYPVSFILNGLSFLVLILGLWQMDFSHVSARPRAPINMIALVKENIKFAFSDQGIRTCMLLSAVICVFGYAYNIILSVITKAMFGGGPAEFSHLAMIVGFGSLLGSTITVHWGSRFPLRWIVGGLVVAGGCQLALAATKDIGYAALIIFFCGLGFMCAFSLFRGGLIHIVPHDKIGVVLGINFSFFYFGMMVSSFFAGHVAKTAGCPAVLVICGSVLLFIALITPFLPGAKKMV